MDSGAGADELAAEQLAQKSGTGHTSLAVKQRAPPLSWHSVSSAFAHVAADRMAAEQMVGQGDSPGEGAPPMPNASASALPMSSGATWRSFMLPASSMVVTVAGAGAPSKSSVTMTSVTCVKKQLIHYRGAGGGTTRHEQTHLA